MAFIQLASIKNERTKAFVTKNQIYIGDTKMKKARFKARVPLTFEFMGNANLSGDELFNEAERQLRKAIKKGLFSTHNPDLEILNKERIKTEKEKREEKLFWDSLFARGV